MPFSAARKPIWPSRGLPFSPTQTNHEPRPHVAPLQADNVAAFQRGSHAKKPRTIGSYIQGLRILREDLAMTVQAPQFDCDGHGSGDPFFVAHIVHVNSGIALKLA